MSTKIRLQRGGTKKRPYYRIVVADSRAPRDGKFIEKVGTHNPLIEKGNENRTNFVKDRIEHWLSTGAVPSERVAILLSTAGIANDNPQMKKILGKREKTIELKKVEIASKKKAEEELKAAEDKKKAEEAAAAEAEAKEAAKAAEAEAKAAAEETPAEEPAS